MTPIRAYWPAALVVAMGAVISGLVAAEPDQRELLRQAAPPWYDASRDDWRRVNLPDEPKKQDESRSSDGISLPIPVDAVGWLLLALVAAGAGWLVMQMWRDQNGATPSDTNPTQAKARLVLADLRDLPFPVQDHTDAEAALAAALAARDWNRAVIWLYGRLLMRLDHAGAIRLAKGITNRQYARTVTTWSQNDPARHAVVIAIETAIAAFERTYFGHQAADETLVTELIRHHDAALPLLATGTKR